MTRHRLALLLLAASVLLIPAAAAFADETLPPYQAKLDEGKDLLEQQQYKEAVKAFREADKLAKGSCADCNLGLARAFNKLNAHKEVLKHVEVALRLTSDKDRLIQAYNEQGLAFMAMAGGDPKQLEQAEKAFRKVLELSAGRSNTARFNLGYTLLRLSRDAEGVALLKEYLAKDPQGPNAEVAASLVENPVRARKRLAPDYELVTLGGEYLTSEDLRGKVVLLDFWGTWCPPCRAAIPDMRLMSRRMEKGPFVLVSVSNDADEAMLRKFISENKMTWPQVWDEKREIIRKFAVEKYPTYILIDHEGEIVYVSSGWGPAIEQELSQRISAALRGAKNSAK